MQSTPPRQYFTGDRSCVVMVFSVVTVLLLSACATPSGVSTTGSSPAPVNRPKPTPAEPATPDTVDISLSIRQQAAAATDAGQYTNASRLLDRAVRLSPRQASNYYEFARLRLRQQQPEEARQFIKKGLSLNPDPATRAQLESLLTTIEN